ncbi:class I fructose-bisphosphate aldolase, partial [bacterium]|nr:class I fructose-bisphosphate aldolase [bacterium]
MSELYSTIQQILGSEAEYLLGHTCKTVTKDKLYLPSPDFIEKVWIDSDRSPTVLRNMQTLYNHGRLAGTGYLSILPVDQGVEHSAGASFAPNPLFFDPENIVRLALEAGCNGVVSTLGVLGNVARRFAHRIPFILKINHNELLSYPSTYDQILFASIDQAFNIGAIGVGATIYFGSEESPRQIVEISKAFEYAHELGLVCI